MLTGLMLSALAFGFSLTIQTDKCNQLNIHRDSLSRAILFLLLISYFVRPLNALMSAATAHSYLIEKFSFCTPAQFYFRAINSIHKLK